MLFRSVSQSRYKFRTYIDRWGTVEQPGVPVHAGYHHWYVDDELVWTAKMRGAWAFCEGAKVVHHHPYYFRM